MRTPFFKYKKTIILLLTIFITYLVYYFSEICLYNTKSPTGYYIDPPRNYFYLKDQKQNKVVQWLQRIPRETYLMGERYESPYTFEEWMEKGKDIDGLEDTLLFLYTSRFKGLLGDSLSKALEHHGTQQSIDFFSERLEKQEWTKEYTNEMHHILYEIVNDEDKFCQLIGKIDKKKKERLSDPKAR